MASLSRLPVEILRMIGDHLTDRHSYLALAALAATCRRHYWVFNNLLYQADAAGPGPSLVLLLGAANGQMKMLQRALALGANTTWCGDVGNPPDPRQVPDCRVTRRHLRDSRRPPRKGTALHLAAMMGRDKAVEWLLDHGAKLHVGGSLLCQCGRPGNRELQAWPSHSSESSTTTLWYPLHLALCHGHVSTFQTLARRGASLDKIGSGNSRARTIPSALHQAAYIGNCQLVDYILAQPRQRHGRRVRAMVMMGEDDEKMALDFVYLGSRFGNREGRTRIIRNLVKHGAVVDWNENPSTSCSVLAVLERAFRCGACGTAIDLLEAGAFPLLSVFPDMVAGWLYITLTVRGYRRLGRDDPPDLYDPKTPEVWQRDRLELVRVLVKCGADLNRPWTIGGSGTVTPVMLSAYPANPPHVALEMLKLVVDLGSNPQATSTSGMTALHYIVNAYLYEFASSVATPIPPLPTLRYLTVDHKVPVDARDNMGKTAIDFVYNTTTKSIGFWQSLEPSNPLLLTNPRLGVDGERRRKVLEWYEQRVLIVETLLFSSPVALPPRWFDMEQGRLNVARYLLQQERSARQLEPSIVQIPRKHGAERKGHR